MFTGIVQCKAAVLSEKIIAGAMKLKLVVDPTYCQALQTGASIAINGTCLTVVSFQPYQNQMQVEFDVIAETLQVTNLGLLGAGDKVNYERAMTLADEVGGHLVSGHIHCCSEVRSIEAVQGQTELVLTCPIQWRKYLLHKGFITVNGVSLTVGKVDKTSFAVYLIPETLQRTNLSALQIGKKVNLEFDQQTITTVDTVERILAAKS